MSKPVSNRRGKAGIAAAVALGIAVLIVFNIPSSVANPTYQNRRLSDWLGWYGHGNTYTDDMIRDREAAMHAFGTNALPYLLQELKCNDSWPKKHLISWANRSDIAIKTQRFFNYDLPVEDWWRLERAEGAYEDLRLKPDVAIPFLLALLDRGVATDVQTFAASELGDLGPAASNAIPRLSSVVHTTTDQDLHKTASEALTKIRTRSKTTAKR